MTPIERASTAIAWRPWGRDAFAEARETRKPILLSISTAWSLGAHEMDRTTYADAGIAATLTRSFVPVRLDADERPDVADRYALGGVPTTAFLTSEGFVIGGGTLVDPGTLRAALPRVIAVHTQADVSSVGEPSEPAPTPVGAPALERLLLDLFDPAHGGVGCSPKFPHTAPIHLALDMYAESKDARMLERATRALDAMGWGSLYDADSGGFHRYCGGADWTAPQREKLLPVNASLLELYVRAGAQTSTDRWLSRASDTLAFLQRDLRRHDGSWRMCPGTAGSRVFSDANATAASAALHTARVFADDDLGRQALKALEHVLLASYKPGDGVAHFAGGVRGLLADQVAMAAAMLDAWEATGNVVYRMMAEELAHYALRTMWDDVDGGFLDRAPLAYADEPAGAARAVKPFVLNCDAAILLRRLCDATSNESFLEHARRTLAAVEPRAALQGPDIAHYLRARRAVLR